MLYPSIASNYTNMKTVIHMCIGNRMDIYARGSATSGAEIRFPPPSNNEEGVDVKFVAGDTDEVKIPV